MRAQIAATVIAALIASAHSAAAGPNPGAPPAPAAAARAAAQPEVINRDGVVGVWYAPPAGRKVPAVLVLGGSEGGLAGGYYLGRGLAEYGYAVFGLAYFGAPGLPKNLQDIPLEYFAKGLDWLRAQPGVDPDRIAIYGVSKGGEAALLVASRHSEIKAVVAGVPSNLVWQGINFTDFTPRSSFDEGGKPIPYAPYDMSRPFAGVLDLYKRSLAAAPSHPEAEIPVERINAPILFISGKADAMWPSAEMAEAAMHRLDARHFRPRHVHLSYPEAGHSAAVPPSDDPRLKALDSLGGTAEGNRLARADMWPKVMAFLDAALRK